MPTLLERVRASRAAIAADVASHVADAETRGDAVTDDEARGLTWFLAVQRAADDELAVREAELVEVDRRADVAAAAPQLPAAEVRKTTDDYKVAGEPRAYQRGDGNSYLLDIGRAAANVGDVDGARSRLALHGRQTATDLELREGKTRTPFEARVNPNRTDGQGGFFVPPLWLVDQFVPLFRAGRTTADLCRKIDLPGGTDSVNIPKVSTGTSAAIQTADAAAVSSTDLTDTSVVGGVKTIAGQQDIALQLLEQSPIAFDEVVFADLVRAYNVAADLQVLSGSNASGQVKGIDTVSGTNAITYTDATPTGPELYPAFAQAISKAAYAAGGHFDITATAFVMHPRRWFWLLGQLDTTGRPLVVPNASAFNAYASGVDTPEALGLVGNIMGVPVYIDGNVNVLAGAGTEDRIYFLKTDDLFLFEGGLRSRALMEVLSGTLQVRLQIYNYLAFIGDRLPGAHSIISGTGLIAPAGF